MPSPPILSVSAAPLSDRAAALEPQRDLAHRGLQYDVRGVPGDRAPLRTMEIFLLYLLDQEGERLGDLGADGMHGHPTLGATGDRVHALPALQIQQGVALALVLPKERPYRSLAGLLQASDR